MRPLGYIGIVEARRLGYEPLTVRDAACLAVEAAPVRLVWQWGEWAPPWVAAVETLMQRRQALEALSDPWRGGSPSYGERVEWWRRLLATHSHAALAATYALGGEGALDPLLEAARP